MAEFEKGPIVLNDGKAIILTDVDGLVVLN